MGLDHKFITKVLQPGGWAALKRSGIDPDMLPPDVSAPVLQFIIDFEHEFGHVPAEQTVTDKFGTDWIESAPEDFDYYGNAIRERYLAMYLSGEIGEAAGLLGDAGNEAVIPKIQHALDYAKHVIALANPPTDLLKSGYSRYEKYEERVKTGMLAGYPLPWDSINKVNPGIRSGEFWLFVGRLKMGKTFVLTKLASWFYQLGLKVLFVSMEMDSDSIGYRFDAVHYCLPYGDILSLNLNPMQLLAYKTQTLNNKDIESRMRIVGVEKVISVRDIETQMVDFQPDIVLIDAIYKLQPNFRTSKTARWESVAMMAHEVQRLCLTTKIPVVGTTQFNKQQKKDDATTSENIGLSWELPQNVNAALGINCSDEERAQHRMRIAVMDGRDFSQLPTIVINWDMINMNFDEIGTFYQGNFIAHPAPIVLSPVLMKNRVAILTPTAQARPAQPPKQASLLSMAPPTPPPASSQPAPTPAPTPPPVNLPGPSNSPTSGGTP